MFQQYSTLLYSTAVEVASYHRHWAIAMIAFGSAFVVFIIVCAVGSRRRNKRLEMERTFTLNVFDYLRPFHVDDLDIRKSPAGGFHITYQNELSHGVIQEVSETSYNESSSSNHSSSGNGGDKETEKMSNVPVDEERQSLSARI